MYREKLFMLWLLSFRCGWEFQCQRKYLVQMAGMADDVGADWQLMMNVIMGMLLWNSSQKVVVERTYTGIKMTLCWNIEAIDVNCWYLSYFTLMFILGLDITVTLQGLQYDAMLCVKYLITGRFLSSCRLLFKNIIKIH